jgi:long-chain acyl-CoA synthetase
MTYRDRTLLAAFLRHVTERPGELALIGRGDTVASPQQWTWGELATRVLKFCRELETQLLGRSGDERCVLYLHRNSVDDICRMIAAMAAHAIEVPVDFRCDLPQQQFIARQIDGVHWEAAPEVEVLNSSGGYPSVDGAALDSLRSRESQIELDTKSLVLWTSGTVSQPKGVVLAHRQLVGNAMAKRGAVPDSSFDVRLTSLPLSHAYGRTCDFGCWLLSGSIMVLGLGKLAWQELARRFPPTIANVVPAIARQLAGKLNDPALSRLRWLGVGGAPLDQETFDRYASRAITVIQGYGLTEAGPVICSSTPDNAKAGFVGEAVEKCEIQLRDGRLYARSPYMMMGYWNDLPGSRARIDPSGWLDTGDLAQWDGEVGQYRILGRADDLIVLPTGNKLHPRDIEAEIESLPGVLRALVILHCNELQLWFDSVAPEVLDDIAKRLARMPSWKRPSRILKFVPSLAYEFGELTIKQTPRRHQIIRNRIPDSSNGIVRLAAESTSTRDVFTHQYPDEIQDA